MRRLRARGIVALASLLGALGCGQQTPPVPGRVPGGVVKGAYVLRVQPSSECTAPVRTFSFAVDASVADNARGQAGFQILSHGSVAPLPPAPRLSGAALVELELRYTSPDVHGGLGTTGVGAAAVEGFQLWSHAVATGQVTHLGTDAGEVEDGTLMGELEFGRNSEDEAGLGFCTSRTHHWSLKLS